MTESLGKTVGILVAAKVYPLNSAVLRTLFGLVIVESHLFQFAFVPGISRATSRKSPAVDRRYIDVLSAVQCQRMSPIWDSQGPLPPTDVVEADGDDLAVAQAVGSNQQKWPLSQVQHADPGELMQENGVENRGFRCDTKSGSKTESGLFGTR